MGEQENCLWEGDLLAEIEEREEAYEKSEGCVQAEGMIWVKARGGEKTKQKKRTLMHLRKLRISSPTHVGEESEPKGLWPSELAVESEIRSAASPWRPC